MKDIFGIPMNGIMIALVILLAMCLLSVVWIALRRPIIFKLGARNIPRRKAQTILIVIGLMLSTLIIASALGLGDSFAYSLTTTSYETSGHVDQVAIATADYETDDYLDFGELRPDQTERGIPAARGDDRIDGIPPFLRVEVPAINGAAQRGEPLVRLM